ncbi:MAG: hypothetical protein AAF465_01775 [Pseudomonadota bacterium]
MSEQYWTWLVVGLVIVFLLGVYSRVRKLMEVSKKIESTLDYSKMKEWEDDDDWGEPKGSGVDPTQDSTDTR